MYVSMEKSKRGRSRFWYPWEIGPLCFITMELLEYLLCGENFDR